MDRARCRLSVAALLEDQQRTGSYPVGGDEGLTERPQECEVQGHNVGAIEDGALRMNRRTAWMECMNKSVCQRGSGSENISRAGQKRKATLSLCT